jgi:hypothetical protein
MEHDWPEEPKTTCLLCGASFLASTAALTGGISRRHGNGMRALPGLPQEKEELFLGISPEGKPILSSEDLSALPFPRMMIVGPGHLNFDGWIICTSPCAKSILAWISSHADRWCKENPDPVVKSQVNEMITALERQVVRGGDAGNSIPESRWRP